MIKLYKAFILPHLEYCSPLFVGIGTGQRNRLEDGNCYILRTLIGHNKSMSYDKLLTTASMTSLYCRRLHQAALILLFKCLNGTGPNYIGSLELPHWRQNKFVLGRYNTQLKVEPLSTLCVNFFAAYNNLLSMVWFLVGKNTQRLYSSGTFLLPLMSRLYLLVLGKFTI